MHHDDEDHATLNDALKDACGLFALVSFVWAIAFIAMHFSPEKLPV